jgi:hypothetical protein
VSEQEKKNRRIMEFLEGCGYLGLVGCNHRTEEIHFTPALLQNQNQQRLLLPAACCLLPVLLLRRPSLEIAAAHPTAAWQSGYHY